MFKDSKLLQESTKRRNNQITGCSWLLIPTRCCERITISKNLATLMNANPASTADTIGPP
jgi:hypothetical protein